MSYESLMRDHERLERLNGELKAVALAAPAPEKAIQLLRDFALAIEQHRADEQQSVYRPLLQLSRTKELKTDINLAALVSEMDSDWDSYLYDWSLECIRSDWPTFAAETVGMLERGKKRLRLEDAVIYPLALREGTIALREPR